MKHKLTPIRSAPAAIAAVLALTSHPLLAQDATAPVIVLPDVTTAEAPIPTVSTPVVQAVPETAPGPAAAEAEATPVAQAPVARPARNAPVAIAKPAADPAPAAEVVPELTAAPQVAPIAATDDLAPVAPVAAAEPVAEAAPVVSDDTSPTGALLGGLAVLGLGALGIAALRRRKGKPTEPGEIAIVEKPRMPVAEAPVARAVEPAPAAAKPAQYVRSNGAVALPMKAPDDCDERSALLRRMVDARPDRANPFLSRKARTKRAKLILQSLDHDFADRDPLIDLGDYPQQWPLLARRRYSAAA